MTLKTGNNTLTGGESLAEVLLVRQQDKKVTEEKRQTETGLKISASWIRRLEPEMQSLKKNTTH